MEELTVETANGPAKVLLSEPETTARGLLVLGPGASGSIGSGDLELACRVGLGRGMAAALVQPPYAVAGRRVPPRGTQTDEAFTAVTAGLRSRFPDGPLITGGRSYGGRVACRTSEVTGSDGVVCLAFPLQPPKGRPSRQDELSAVTVPVLVVQGESDPFGMPEPPASGEIVVVKGDHSLKADAPLIREAIGRWLDARLAI